MIVSCNWRFCQDWSGSSQVCRTCSAGPVSDLVSTIACHVSKPILMLLPMEDHLLLSLDQRSHPLHLKRELVLDRLAYPRQYLETQVLSQRATALVIESWRDNTSDAHNTAWHEWHCWCTEWDINPISVSGEY